MEATGLAGRVSQLPTREQINLPVEEQLIVELYSQSNNRQLTTDNSGPSSVRSCQL